ncbi:hypothetical protein PsAD2_01950 [Pseudovibrio axinellae]|uniref:Uncharacterized protein n=1 Tax=Pseudovibrio axinellae TaxID=989403 RepID=A0A165Z0V4_9HYPH|nr:hypothetical protein [Pseudovibrio axinellae]KZL19411.1 hypothetical protein PsAD2_01950 [Pseudovibrio axinellae]SER59192.1 hypothetical protein SAMN05421798_11348 [Pseudovibrio axinellae]
MTSKEATAKPTVSGPRMIVPMQMDCLLVGTPNQKVNWAKLGLNYDQMLKGGDALTSEVSPKFALETGAHLHFTVPKALRHGTQNADGLMTYPDLPNRWLVTRILSTAPGAKPQLTSWIVESDYLESVQESTQAQWLLNTADKPTDTPQLVAKGLGRSLPLAQWAGEPLTDTADITVSAPGSIRWAAAYSGTQNVLSFHDPLSDYSKPANGSVSVGYMVIGWYQPVTEDPFSQVAQSSDAANAKALWQEIMTSFTWALSVSETDAQQDWEKWLAKEYPSGSSTEWTYPAQMLCNSVYLDLNWTGSDTDYAPATTDITDLGLAIGQNSSQALAAWLAPLSGANSETTSPQTGTQKNNLLMSVFGNYPSDTYANTINFNAKAQASKFSPQAGGTQWVVRPANQSNASTGAQAASSSAISVDLSADALALLIELNQAQATYDQVLDDIADLNWRIFAVAYLRKQASDKDASTFDATPYDAALTKFKATLTTQQTKQAQAETSIKGLTSQLETSVGSEFQVLQSPLSQFMAPNDPTLIVSGKGVAGQNSKAGNSAQNPTLEVRVTGETLTELTFSWTSQYSGITVNGSVNTSTLISDLNIASSSDLPVEYQWLLCEAILLNPGNSQYLANLIATNAGQSLSDAELKSFGDAITSELHALYPEADRDEDHDPVADASKYFEGVAPSQIGVRLGYLAPWSPLVLDWKLNWYPDASQNTEDTPSGPFELTGHTILNASAFDVFAARLQNFISTSPTFEGLTSQQKDFLRSAETLSAGQDVLIQTMGGFEQAFLGRKQEMFSLTSDDPVIQEAILSSASAVPGNIGLFNPLRQGYFEFTGVYVADAFGQVLNIIDSGQSSGLKLSIPPDQHSDDGDDFVSLSKALAQPSKLDITLMSAQAFPRQDGSNASVPVNSASASSPIIGWLLPNRLEQSLMVFEADGTPAGTVRSIYSQNSAGLRWESAPGQPISLGAPPKVENALFAEMLTGLLKTQVTQSDAALEGLLQLAALNSWAMSAKGGQPLNGNLQDMLGTPIAVVSARLAFTQKGPQLLDPTKLTVSPLPASPIKGLTENCNIGDFELAGSGVLGSYINNDFSELITAKNYQETLPEAASEAVHHALTRAIPEVSGTYINTQSEVAFTVSSTQSPSYMDLVILLDPRGQIPVTSSMIPASRIQLTPQVIAPALQTMSANFRIGPVLTPADGVSLPLPGGTQGKWEWVEVQGTGWDVTPNLLNASATPQLGAAPAIVRDGWLSLPPLKD